MTDKEPALAVIRRAIRNEIAGQRFYNEAAYYCIDPWTKDIFAVLAQEEDGHARLLLLEYQALSRQGKWIDPAEALDSPVDIDITQFTFPDDESGDELFPPQWSAADVVDRRADDLAALAFGLQMEQQAIALYGAQAGAAADRYAREAYEFLAAEEIRHFEQMKEQWEKLAGMPFDAV